LWLFSCERERSEIRFGVGGTPNEQARRNILIHYGAFLLDIFLYLDNV
jgi:hypothetical protein